jgi:ribulose-phosphate 3-epimerase
MSVNPGFGGQVFIPHSLDKIRAVRQLLDRAGNADAAIEVDGGVDLATVASVVQAGAEMLVAGNAIFGHPHHDVETATRELRAAAVAAAQGASR